MPITIIVINNFVMNNKKGMLFAYYNIKTI